MNKFFQILMFIVIFETLCSIAGIGHFEGSGLISGIIAAGPASFSVQTFWALIYNAALSLSGLELLGGAIFIGGALFKGDLAFAAAIGLAMMTIVPDLNVLYGILSAISPIFATIIVMPLMIAVVWTIFEWMRTPLA